MKGEFDLKNYSLPSTAAAPGASSSSSVDGPQATPPTSENKSKTVGRFLKGPVPMAWINAASSLPGKALGVGIQLWHLVGLTKEKTVKINLSRLGHMGIKRDAAKRGLVRLERAALVSVQWKKGACPIVTVLHPEPTTPNSIAEAGAP